MTVPPEHEHNAELAAALRDVIAASDAAEQSAARPHRDRHPVQRLTILVGIALLAWLWITRPAWVFGPRPPSYTAAEAQAAARYGIVLQQYRIEQYRRRHGSLPTTLTSLGPSVGVAVDFAPLGSTDYRLSATVDSVTVVFVSGMAVDSFLGNSLAILQQRTP